MKRSFQFRAKVRLARVLSSAVGLWLTFATLVAAHEVIPTVINMQQDGQTLTFVAGPEGRGVNLEAFLAGIDLSQVTDTNDAPNAAEYDALRAMEPDALAVAMQSHWPVMSELITVTANGEPLELTLADLQIPEVGNIEILRASELTFTVEVPDGTNAVVVSWPAEYGGLFLRQTGVENPYDGYLSNGGTSGPILLEGGSLKGVWETFFSYIPTGFDHIVPKGLDHILFVLGLFFLSTRLGPLLWQISAFTLAHTITLALASLGYVTIPGSIVEPLIALSIVYVAVENLYSTGLSRWRPAIIFGFGLLHGLGFASVLAEFGLPDGSFIPALIGFNIGVELGQVLVIAIAYLCVFAAIATDATDKANRPLSYIYLGLMVAVMLLLIPLGGGGDLVALVVMVSILFGLCAGAVTAPRFENYREMVAIPASILIAVVAAYWCVERVFL